MNKKKIIRVIKAIFALVFVLCVGAFLYFSISVYFPVFYKHNHPTIRIYLTPGPDKTVEARYEITKISLHNRFGSHIVLNPFYGMANKMFGESQTYKLCLNSTQVGLSFKGYSTQDWFESLGRIYTLEKDELDRFIKLVENNTSVSEVKMVRGNCTKANYEDNYLAKFSVFFELPELSSYEYVARIMVSTYSEAVDELNARLLYDEGLTELHKAIVRKCYKCIKLLIDNGANINGPANPGKSTEHPKRIKKKDLIVPLHMAMRQNDIEMFKYLIGLGAKASLIHAAKSGQCQFLALQLESGGDVNELEENGISPIAFAVRSDRLKCVKYLVNHGADVNAMDIDWPILHSAMFSGNYELVVYLLEQGAKKELKDKYGRSAYDVAKWKNIVKDSRIRDLFDSH